MVDLDLAEIERLLAAATPGEWQYRPVEDDDWGWIRSERQDGIHPIVAMARAGRRMTDEQLAEHRRNGTDPYDGNARLIAAAPAALRSLIARLRTLEAALRWVEDHSNDPAVVREARATLAGSTK